MLPDTPESDATDEWNALAARYADPSAYVAVVDHDFVLRAACDRAHEMFGIDPSDVLGQSTMEVIHPADLERALNVFSETSVHIGIRPPDVYRIRFNGLNSEVAEYRAFDVTGDNLEEFGGVVVFTLRELSERRRAEMLAIEQIEILESLGSGASLGSSVKLVANLAERHIDASLCVISLIDNTGHLRSYRPDDSQFQNTHDWDGVLPEDAGANLAEATKRRLSFIELDISDGEHWSHISGLESDFVSAVTTPAFDPSGGLIGFIEILRSTEKRPDNGEMAVHGLAARLIGLLSDRHQFESILADAAHQDSLTGLGNRRLLAKVLAEHDDAETPVAIFAIDLDQFTWINNNLGHIAGDQLLVGVAERFVSVLPNAAAAFRPGGDEFAVVLTGDLSQSTVLRVGQRLIESLTEPFSVGPVMRRIRASVGIATREPGESGDSVLTRADAAMYSAKADGGSGVRIFDETDGRNLMRRMSLADELRAAIHNNELCLVYQPKFDLQSHRVDGVEALVRWSHPTHGLLAPEEFVPIAEESSLILALDEWVLGQAYAQLETWAASRPMHDPIDVWVNLSARTLDRSDLLELLNELVGGDPSPQLGLELTERDGFDDIARAKTVFEGLAAAGFQVAIDDFGTGQASLQHLAEFDITSIKIDRTFVGGMSTSRRYRVLVESILSLARSLDLSVVAEGIETVEQLRALQDLGCTLGQGYLMSRPLLPEALEAIFGADLSGRWDPTLVHAPQSRQRLTWDSIHRVTA